MSLAEQGQFVVHAIRGTVEEAGSAAAHYGVRAGTSVLAGAQGFVNAFLETWTALGDDGPTKEELYERAKELDIEGRSKMSKEELAAAIAASTG